MTNFIAWIPPAGEVADAPVHPETLVLTIHSDGYVCKDEGRAKDINWSAEGDGPCVIAYAIVEEYTPAPKVAREWWLYRDGRQDWEVNDEFPTFTWDEIIHVREVLERREVVAWAVVDQNGHAVYHDQEDAQERVDAYGGTVVRLSGVMP